MHSGTVERRVLLLRALSLAPLIALGVAYCAAPRLRELLNQGTVRLVHGDLEGLRASARSLGPWAALFTTALMIVQALAAPIPAVLVTWTNSWLFGPFWGGWLSIASATLAALLCFALARALGEPLVARFVRGDARARADAFLARHGAATVLVARLLPFVPFDPISYVAGLSRMSAWTFAWATFAGQIPAGMAYSYLGQEIARPGRLLLLGLTTLAALAVLGLSVRRALAARGRI